MISDGGLVYTFKIRPTAKWFNGDLLTVADFVYSLTRIEDLKEAAGYANILYPIKNAQAVNTGKMEPSTLGRALLRLVPSEGRISFEGRDISGADAAHMRPLRRALQIVFQDPYGSLSPRMTVGAIVTESLLVHAPGLSAAERDRRAIQILQEVGLDPATRNRYPHEFSGGQRQRIAIARALILKPKAVILDEPTSALDRSVQKQIIELLRKLQESHNLSYIFISHDLAVVRALADYVIVMREGKIVEQGTRSEIFKSPRETYTKALMAASFITTSPAEIEAQWSKIK